MSFDNFRERSKVVVKPLKPGTLVDNLFVNGIDAKSAKIENLEVVGGIQDLQLFNVEIYDSVIENTIIGTGNPGPGFFTTIQTGNPSGTGYNVCFFGITPGEFACWEASSGTWNISGDLIATQTSELGNIGISNNTISSINTNGDINIDPNGFGTVRVSGPVSQHATIGNFLIDLDNGFVNVNSRGDVTLNSEQGSGTFSVNDGILFSTKNGDITLQTEIANTQNVTLIDNTGGLLRVTTSTNHNLNIGDTVFLSGTNSVPAVSGNFTIGNVLTDTSFVIVGNVTSNSTTGNLFKRLDNEILLNAATSVKIPSDVTLTFGRTCNSISGNTSAMLVKTCGDLLLDVPGSNSVKLVNANTKLEFTTSGNTYLSYNQSTSELDLLTNTLHITSDTIKMDTPNVVFTDPILTLGGQVPKGSDDNKDRGIEFYYHTGTQARLGWFGYKDSTGRFTFIPNATNTNEVITGDVGDFEYNTLFVNEITILTSDGFIDMNCGEIINVSSITGCDSNLEINGTANVTVNASNQFIVNTPLVSLPNQGTPIAFGTCGSKILENTSSNLVITGCKNIQLNTTQNGAVSLPQNTLLTFTGSTLGTTSISGDTSGTLSILSGSHINLGTTSGNVIIPSNTKLQLGGTSEYISGNTASGLVINSSQAVNVSAVNNIQLTTTTGNILLNVLDTTNTVNIPTSVGLVFAVSGTSNSISSNTSGDLLVNGTISRNVIVDNVSSINLYSDDYVKIQENTKLALNGTLQSYITATGGSFQITNESSTGNITITSQSTNLSNTGGTLNISNASTNITSSNWLATVGNTNITGVNNFTITGNTTSSTILLCTKDVRICDPIITLSHGVQTSNNNKDRGIEYLYYDTTTSTEKLGWFGWKNTTSRFTFYSDAVNTDEVISGTIGGLHLGDVFINNTLEFLSAGVIDLNCGELLNVSDIIGCDGDLTIHASNNVSVSSGSMSLITDRIDIKSGTPLNFGSTSNSISNGNTGVLTISAGDKVVINANLQVLGTTTEINSTVTTLVDPIFTLGGSESPTLDDNKDRGIAFRYHTGTESRLGYFGFLDNSYKWTYIPNATNVNEVITGDRGDIDISGLCADNITFNASGGNILGVTEISGGEIDIITTSGNLNLTVTSGNSVVLPFDIPLSFGSTSNSISTDTSGNTIWNTGSLSINTAQEISLDGNTVRIPESTYLYFGDSPDASTGIIKNTSGNLEIINTQGNILLTPSQTISSSTGHIVIPANNPITFCNYSNRIESDCDTLSLYGYNGVNINGGVTTILGDLNVIGSISASSQTIDINDFILPLGTNQVLSISDIQNGPVPGQVDVTTNVNHNLVIGDTVELTNTNSDPIIDGVYTVLSVVDSDTIRITASTLTLPGTLGGLKSTLVINPGRDVGIQVNWHTGVTTGTAEARFGFFGFKRDTLNWTFYERGVNVSDVFTGTLGNIELNKANVSKISGFTLEGTLNGGSQTIFGSNFNIDGGTIDGTVIGSTIASTGRFTTLTSTIQANLNNVTLSGNLNYSCEEFTVNSGFPVRNPLTNVVVSFINVSGVSFSSTANTMADGTVNCQVKKLVVGSMGTGCEYHLNFTAGKLIASDACSPGTPATLIKFKRQGQSVELLWYSTISAWVLSGGSGAYVT